MTGLKKIKPSARLAEEVYDQIYAGINSGVIDPNERIVQERLADELEVSRTPVREALLRLEHEGILVREKHGRFVVRRFSKEEIVQIYSAREAVECHALALLCEMSTSKLIKKLCDVVEKEEKDSICYTINEYYEANKHIHRTFVKETGNRFLLEMFDMIWNRSVGFVVFSDMADENLPISLTGHLELCDVVKRGSPREAADTMRRHIREGLTLQSSVLKVQAGTFNS